MRGSSSSLCPSQQRELEEELPVYEFDAGEEAVETAARKLVALYHPSRLQADFDAGDEAVEAAARKLVARYHPSRLLADGDRGGGDDDGITKYSFLQTFQSGQQMKQSEVTGVFCIDVPDSNDMKESFAAGSPEMNQVSHERTTVDVAMATSTSYSDHNNACLDEFEATRITRFGSWRHFELQPHGIVADSEEESLSSSPESLSTTNCDVPGYVEQKMQYGYNGFDEMIVEDGPVILNPEFVMCNAALHMEPQLTFSPDCFKIEYSDLNAYGDDAKMAIKWEISDIICIYCKWTQSVTSAMLRLHVRSTMEAENLGPVRLQFSLNDAHWPKKQQTIWNLASRYQEIWNSIPLDDFTSEDWCVEPSLFFPKRYFSETKDFEDVIYPKGDPDAVSINKRDVDLLLPETFVNDTIIDFYIKYLSSRIQPTEKHRYHFFNSFFFRKLADLDKDQGKAPDGRAAFLRVRKWTRKVNLFEKDFVFIPVNFNLHWSLIVICHPGEVVTLEDDDIRKSPKVPCILHMDSLKGSHCGLKDIIQSYLWEEWKERNPESALDNSEKFLNLRFVSLELPQQDNSFDCGLFLLHYVELFLVDAPSSFNPLTIDEFSSFLSDDWFPPAEASLKRALIRKLIYELVTESSQNSLRATSFDEDHDENYHRSDEIEREPGIEFLAQSCSAGVSNSLSVLDGGLEMRQPSTSICLDNSVEKAVVTSGCILEAGKVSMISVENLAPGLHEIAECLDKDEMVCSSSQDEKNEPPCTNINDQLGSRLCASEDIEALEASGSMVKDKRSHEDSSLICLDDSQKSSSQTEAVSHDMDAKCCSVSENAEETKVCERHLSEWNADEVADVQCEALHVMDTAVIDDTKKDVIGHSPGRNTVELDNHRCGASQDMDLVMTCGVDKDMGVCSLESNAIKLDDDTCEAPQEVDSVMVDDARSDNVKEAGTSVHELNGGKQSISAKLKEGNTDNGMIAAGYAERDEAPADGEGVDNANVVEEDAPCKTCSDGKRPRLDDTCSEKDVTSDGGSPLNKDDVRGSDAKTQLQYKRRKVANPDGEKRRTRSSTRGSPLI